MARLNQLNLTFLPEEDRMLFRLSTSGRPRSEFRFLLTRRYVRILWNALIQVLKAEHEAQSSFKSESSKATELQAAHQEAISEANFNVDYEGSQLCPLGEEPILATKFALKAGPNQKQTFCIYPKNGEGLEFDLNNQLLHRLCRLLADLTRKAEWDLDLDFGQAEELIGHGGLN